MNNNKHAFTIVELLVVIVVIGILASLTIVAYSGVARRAIVAVLESDLNNASKQLELFKAENSAYPETISCNIPDSTVNKCVKASSGNTYSYPAPDNASNPQTFTLDATNGATTYRVTNDSAPAAVISTSLAVTDPANWLAVGNQVWAKYNLNVGTMVTGVTTQTNNAILEKYCYDNLELNCTTYGGLYQWAEAVQYLDGATNAFSPSPAFSGDVQGICPADSHIPSDNDWKILEMQLGMSQEEADATDYRGTDQGAQLLSGGTSGLDIPIAGFRIPSGPFDSLSSHAYVWSSSDATSNAWERHFYTGDYVERNVDSKSSGFSVRCLGN